MSEYGTTKTGTTPKSELPQVPISDTNLCLKSKLKKKKNRNSLVKTVLNTVNVRKPNVRFSDSAEIRTIDCSVQCCSDFERSGPRSAVWFEIRLN